MNISTPTMDGSTSCRGGGRVRFKKDASRLRLSGGFYELQWAGLIAARLRALRRSCPALELRFLLATNVRGAKPFDDIVMHLRWLHQGNERQMTYFVQLKHKEDVTKHVTTKDLTGRQKQSEEFNLLRYYKIFEESKNNTKTREEVRNLFCGDYRLVVLTTRPVLPQEARMPSSLDFPFEEVFCTGQGEAFSLGEDHEIRKTLSTVPSDFFRRLRICSAQAQVSALGPLLIKALNNVLDALPRPHRFLSRYTDFLLQWWDSDRGDCLSEDSSEIDDVMQEDILSQLEHLRFQTKYQDALAQRLEACDAAYIVVRGIPPRLRASLAKATLEQSHPGRFTILTKHTLEEYSIDALSALCCKVCDEVVIAVDPLEKTSWEEILQRLFSNKKRKVRILASAWDETFFERVSREVQCDAWSENWTMAQFEDSEQKRLLRGSVSFQGHDIALSALSDAWLSMRQDVRGAALGALAAGNSLTLGAPLPQLDQHYVPRTLEHQTILSSSVFDIRSPKDHFMLRGFSEDKLEELRSTNSSWEEYSPQTEESRGDRPPPTRKPKWRVWDNRNESSNPSSWNNVHWLSSDKGEILWEKSDGNSQCLVEHIKKMTQKCAQEHSCSHDDPLDFLDWKNSTIFLKGHAGAGKSTFVTKIARTIKREKTFSWVLIFKISEGKTLESIPMEMELHHILDGLHSVITSSRTDDIRTEKQFLKNCIEQSGGITVLVDGVDEVCPHLKAKALRFLEVLQSALEASGGRLWVAARTVLEEDLARGLRCATPLSLLPFTREDQKRYFLSSWSDHMTGSNQEELEKRVDALVAAVRESTASGDRSLYDHPLYTRMLADAYTAEEVQQIFNNSESAWDINRFSLYKKFIQKALSNFWTKRDISESTQIILDLQHGILKKQSEYGAFECFNDREMVGEHYNQLLEAVNKLHSTDEREKIAQTGIITEFVDGKPKFLHHTLAEYLAAFWLKDKYKSLPELTKALYSGEFGEVRYFFDGLLAEGHPLHEAALGDSPELITAALREDQHVDAEDAGGRRALHLAAICGHWEAVDTLIDNEASVGLRDHVLGWTPLTYADATQPLGKKHYTELKKNEIHRLAAVELLLRAGAESTEASRILGDPGCISCSFVYNCYRIVELFLSANPDYDKEHVWNAARNGRTEVLQKLFDSGFIMQPDFLDFKESTLLHTAAERGIESTCDLLLNHGAFLEQKNKYGETPLHNSAYWGKENACRLLVERGAEINVRSSWGETPLTSAARRGREGVCRLLLDKGAEVNAATEDTALVWAARKGYESICTLLLDEGADVNAATSRGETALFRAAGWGHESICRILLERGADIDAVTSRNKTALMWAARWGRENVCRLLLERQANVNVATSTRKITALFWSADYGHESVCRLLLEHDADINAETSENETAYHAAAVKRHTRICSLLLENGASVNTIPVLPVLPERPLLSLLPIKFPLITGGSGRSSLLLDTPPLKDVSPWRLK